MPKIACFYCICYCGCYQSHYTSSLADLKWSYYAKIVQISKPRLNPAMILVKIKSHLILVVGMLSTKNEIHWLSTFTTFCYWTHTHGHGHHNKPRLAELVELMTTKT